MDDVAELRQLMGVASRKTPAPYSLEFDDTSIPINTRTKCTFDELPLLQYTLLMCLNTGRSRDL